MRLPSPYDRMLAPVYVPTLLMSLSQEALLILLPLYVLELGASPGIAALVVGLRGVGVLLFDVPAGMLVARFGDKPVLIGGLVSILFGMFALALAPGVWAVAPAALLLGAGYAAWMLGRQSYITQTCAPGEVGRAIAVMAGLQRVGAFAGPAAGGLIASALSYPAAFLGGAISVLIAGACVLVFTQHVEPARSTGGSLLAGTGRVLRAHGSTFATAGTAALALQLMRATRQLLVPLAGQSIGLDVASIGILYSMSAAVDMSLFYPVGVLVDRRGRKWSAVPCMVLFAAGLALLPFATDFAELLGAVLLLGLANGLGTGIVMILGSDFASASGRRGEFLGLWRLIGDAGMSGAPLLAGALLEVSGMVLASTVAAGIGLAGALVMVFLVGETLPAGDRQRLR
ncbi:MAG: MFS transporter [Gammaproteobacteria bacterium]|nr:MFS transporter [Gammaproteobacteria bacterium]